MTTVYDEISRGDISTCSKHSLQPAYVITYATHHRGHNSDVYKLHIARSNERPHKHLSLHHSLDIKYFISREQALK